MTAPFALPRVVHAHFRDGVAEFPCYFQTCASLIDFRTGGAEISDRCTYTTLRFPDT